MNLRKEIQLILAKWVYGSDESAIKISDKILSLPSGLIAKKECPECIGGAIPSMPDGDPEPCRKCNMTGTISRDLTIQEAIEFAKGCIDYQPDKCYALPNGERVEVKK